MKTIVVKYTISTFPYDIKLKFIEVPDELNTWKEYQMFFDPAYNYNNLKFYNLGEEIKLRE
jgi:hypothetical protein